MKSRRKYAKSQPSPSSSPYEGRGARETMLPALQPLTHDSSTERCAAEVD